MSTKGQSTADAAYGVVAETLFSLPSAVDRFNPYAQRRPDEDRTDAVEIRRMNLKAYLRACQARVPLFLLAEAPGPWGCGFSGVPITSEAQLLDPDFPLAGRQASSASDPHTEYSANIFWNLLSGVFPDFMVWNACPLHPHRPGAPFSIRAPRQSELREFGPLVEALVHIYQPRGVVAVGRKAERTLSDLGIDATYVRHPSQGGATLFRDGIARTLQELAISHG